MTRCRKSSCKLKAWRKGLCFLHWKESQGFKFDSARGVFVRKAAA